MEKHKSKLKHRQYVTQKRNRHNHTREYNECTLYKIRFFLCKSLEHSGS